MQAVDLKIIKHDKMLQRNIICRSVHFNLKITFRQNDKFKTNTIYTIFYTEEIIG